MSAKQTSEARPRIYDGDGDALMEADRQANRVIILPSGDPKKATATRERIRVQWGQFLLADMMSRRYRTLICGVNPEDNSRGLISTIGEMIPTSQWDNESITKYARGYAELSPDKVLVLKYDMDEVNVLALLRPLNRDAFTLDDLKTGLYNGKQILEPKK